MSLLNAPWLLRKPSRPLAWGAAGLLTTVWGVLRLVIFHSIIFPLTYALPLLICVWTRDRVMLWFMAVSFAVMHTVKQWWILPSHALPTSVDWATYGATLLNIGVAAFVIQAIMALRDRLERSLEQVRAQAAELASQNEQLVEQSEELERQNEELAQQSEELGAQAEELSQQVEEISQQSEELSTQNVELQAQSEEIHALNTELRHREALLQTLFESARLAGSQAAAARHVCESALDMLGDAATAVAIYEAEEESLVLRGAAARDDVAEREVRDASAPLFVKLLMEQNRTASVNDVSLRPDLALVTADGPAFRSMLGAPLRADGAPRGAVTVYCREAREWTAQQFRTAEWVAAQAAHILEILRLHEALTRANEELGEADRRKSEFLATLSHELRNPLVPIRFAVEMLDGNGRGGEPSGPRQIIERQLGHLVRLVDDLLDVTRIASNKVRLRTERVALAGIIDQALEATSHDMAAAGHQLMLSVPREPVWVDADAVRLSQVLTNLLKNAIRYTPAGGRISVSAERDGDHVVLSVRDTGIGLSPEDLARIFDMFAQVGEPGHGGLGIGLALVKGLVELHGGTVSARSAGPGLGSEFSVRLPRAEAPSETPGAERVPPGPAARQRILVVDDNADSALMLRTFLEMQGHEVHVAYDGVAALAEAERVRPDVGLFDIGLPGLDGYELAERLRSDPAHRKLFLIALTGWGQEDDRRRAQSAGFNAHLTKPADPDTICELLSRAAAGNVQIH